MAFKDNLIKGLSSGLGSGITSSVFGALSSVLQNHFANKQADKMLEQQKEINQQTFEQNQALAHQQNQYNIEQWNRENQYNSPKAQMARFAAAGLNPDLIYNQSNTSASSPSLVAGTPQNPTSIAQIRQAALQQSAQLQNTFAQNRLLNAQARNIEANTRKTSADAHQSEIQGFILDSTKDFTIETAGVQKDMSYEQLDLLRKQWDLSKKQEDILSEEWKRLRIENRNYVDYWNSQVETADANKRMAIYNALIQSEQWSQVVERFAKEMRAADDKHNLDVQQLAVLRASLAATLVGIRSAELDNEMKSLQIKWAPQMMRADYTFKLLNNRTAAYNANSAYLDVIGKGYQNEMSKYVLQHQNADWWYNKTESAIKLYFHGVQTATGVLNVVK